MTTATTARFSDLVAAEWIKLRSLRSTTWTLGVTALFVIAATAIGARATGDAPTRYTPEQVQALGFSLRAAFPQAGAMMLMLVAASVGAIAVVSEYGSGLIRTTTVAVPARGSVVLAKAVVVTGLWTVAGAVISTVQFVLSQAIMGETGISITYPGALPALLAATLLAPVCALFGLGLGVLIRHTAATIVTGVVVLLVLPLFFSPAQPFLAIGNHVLILSAWQRLTQNAGTPGAVDYPYAPFAESCVVYAAWPLVAVVLALIVVRKRDV